MAAIIADGSKVEFEDGGNGLFVDGQKIDCLILSREAGRIVARIGDSIREILYEFRDGHLELHCAGLRFECNVASDRDLLIGSLETSGAAGKFHSDVRAPMPGLVTKVCVSRGETVKRGATLVILEAMKMENEIRSPRDGIISELYVANGAIVEKDQVLSSLE